MEKDVKPILVAHTNNFFRRHLTIEKTFFLLLDGHSSRVGYKWLDTAMGQTLEVVQLPTNTTHFLQPCDSDINMTFKKAIKNECHYLGLFNVLI